MTPVMAVTLGDVSHITQSTGSAFADWAPTRLPATASDNAAAPMTVRRGFTTSLRDSFRAECTSSRFDFQDENRSLRPGSLTSVSDAARFRFVMAAGAATALTPPLSPARR